MKRALVSLAMLVLALLAARVALADARYTDPAGDSGGAPDITAVTVANDAAGNLTFTITTNQPALAADAGVYTFFDTDKNAATGDQGIEFALFAEADGWEFDRWDGSKYVEASAPSANATYSNGVLTFKIAKADFAGVSSFVFYVYGLQWDAADKVIASDDAPNGTEAYTYTLSTPAPAPKPLTLRASTPVSVPLRPVHGKAFSVRVAVTRGDTGGPLASGVVTCKVTVGLKALRAVGSVSAGKAGCRMVIPAAAKGKRLRGTIKVTFRNISVTKSFSYLIR
jgi:hypothetical protein